MKNLRRFGIILYATAPAQAPASAVAQNAVQPAPPPREDVIGPDQLRDFSLNGTVTQPAEPARSSPPPGPPAGRQTEPATRSTAPAGATTDGARNARPPTAATPARSMTLELPPPSPAATGAPPAPAPSFSTQPNGAPPAMPAEATAPPDAGPTLWPWLAGLLVVALGAFAFAFRQRRQPAYAAPVPYPATGELSVGAGKTDAPGAIEETAERRAAVPPAAGALRPELAREPAPPPPPVGVISTRLRPWIELQFAPIRLLITPEGATIEFDVVVQNSGAVPARDVLIEACMVSASPTQDEELAGFFAKPLADGDGIPLVPPLKRIPLKSGVTLPTSSLRPFQVDDRRLFVPLVAFNALYRWSGGQGQTSASFLVGRATGREKMGPFGLDGAREFARLDVKLHNLGVRT